MRAALYARVSTSDQNNRMQVSELLNYAKARGWTVFAVYEDQISGAKQSRPALDRLMADARQRKFDAVLVWKLDRFGRSLIHLVNGVLELEALGIRFIAVTQGIDTDQSNPMAKLLLHIMAAFAEFERSMIRERINAGMQHARENGTPLGRPPVIFRRDKALEMHAAGATVREIAQEFGIGVGTAHRLIKGTIFQPPGDYATFHNGASEKSKRRMVWLGKKEETADVPQ